jgi:hypothetical protein
LPRCSPPARRGAAAADAALGGGSAGREKLTYEVPNFRIGGKYDLAQPAAWADGGVGGTTLESLGAKPARTSYIAMGTPKRNAKGEIVNAIVINSYYSGDATAMVNNWVGGQAGNTFSGGALVGPGCCSTPIASTSCSSMRSGCSAPPSPPTGSGRKFPGLQLLRRRAPELPAAARSPEGRQGAARHRRLDGATQAYYWG